MGKEGLINAQCPGSQGPESHNQEIKADELLTCIRSTAKHSILFALFSPGASSATHHSDPHCGDEQVKAQTAHGPPLGSHLVLRPLGVARTPAHFCCHPKVLALSTAPSHPGLDLSTATAQGLPWPGLGRYSASSYLILGLAPCDANFLSVSATASLNSRMFSCTLPRDSLLLCCPSSMAGDLSPQCPAWDAATTQQPLLPFPHLPPASRPILPGALKYSWAPPATG